jgi:uncharacterized protein (TIGR03000 family)
LEAFNMKTTGSLPQRRLAIRAMALAGLILSTGFLVAGGPPPGIPSGVMPWEWHKYQGYRHGSEPRPRTPPPPVVTRSPRAYTLQVTTLPYQHKYEQRDVAFVVAHLPEDAQVFFEDQPTYSRGTVRQYISPPLKPGMPHHYTVRVVWPEEGEWVSQMVNVPIHAGGVHCIDVIHSRSSELEKDIAAALAKLPPEDRKLAGEQKFCAVQEGVRLGSMGTPVKVSMKGQSVFLCCPSCEGAARKGEDRTLKTAESLKAKNRDSSSPSS